MIIVYNISSYSRVNLVLIQITFERPQQTTFPHIDAFWCLWSRRLLKTLWQKKKLLMMSNFSFSHNVFHFWAIGYPFNYREFPFILQNMFKVVWCRFLVCGKGLKLKQCLERHKHSQNDQFTFTLQLVNYTFTILILTGFFSENFIYQSCVRWLWTYHIR